MHGRRLLHCVCVLLLVAGCAPADPGAALLGDYRARVLRTLAGDPGATPEFSLAPWPRTRDRRLEVPAQRADLIEFLRLQNCGLGALVGNRASSLGRVMRPPERLRYELAFLEEGARCLAELDAEEESEMRAFLEEVLGAKRDALGAVIWNATLGSDALARQHALGADSLEPAATRGAGAAATGALHGLADRAAGSVDHRVEDWHAPWEALAASRFGGRLRRSLEVLAVELEAVAEALEARGLLCPAGRASERARILENVFRRYYVVGVQPYLAEVDGAAADWAGALARLAEVQRVIVPETLAPDPARRSLARMRAARDRHTRAWQDTLSACGLGPGSS
ncbi:MAG: DUF3080 family protein [Pseudomonadales bacterium]|nr:DUF3080 family protein [Pseudomonadales bacterium]